MIITMIFFSGKILAAVRGLGNWNRTYRRLSTRYAGSKKTGGVMYGYLLSNPSLTFNYGQTTCTLRNRRSLRFRGQRQTELLLSWPDRKLRLEISSGLGETRHWAALGLRAVSFPPTDSDQSLLKTLVVESNQPELATDMISGAVQWQLEKIRRLTDQHQLLVSILRGQLSIAVPGYIKDYQRLDDFVQIGLELYEQMMLANVEGIEFLREDEASIVSDVKCPICSETITQNMVMCNRCKTPHCLDCWQYNGQCATFACRETRFVQVGRARTEH